MTKAFSINESLTAMTATPGDTSISIAGVAARRITVTGFIAGALGTMADAMAQWQLRRFDTADGTGTTLATEAPSDPVDASLVVCKGNHTVEPTYGSLPIPVNYPCHLRATAMWHARPGNGLIIPAVATEGIGLVGFEATYTGLVGTTLFWEE